jgi:hypothetical protein
MAFSPMPGQGCPDLSQPLALNNLDLWQCWRAIKAPTMVLRGMHSDLLPFDNQEPGKDVGGELDNDTRN